ncbi:hypothetical protein ACIBO1_25340 [Micromonospora sp. NPDC049903]|uniref:hypothetical protein n=1 Tax=Micromonospora sp. NPDC049903 TaxID=3364276 RepID=UPI0037A60A30
MATSAPLSESLHSPSFWARYTFAHADGAGADRLGDLLDDDLDAEPDDDDGEDDDPDAEFEVGDGCRLLLTADVGIDFHSLEIVVPGSAKPAELGWDDLAHWHPYALRWSELDLICRAIAALDPGYSHPGAPLALLCRYAAVFADDDVDAAVAAVEAAYASLRPPEWDGYWPRGTDWLQGADFRGQGVVWQSDEDGNRWAAQEDGQKRDFYSTRGAPATGGFPHAELRTLLAAAAATVGRR